jgi:hypothetical protein
MRQAPPLQQEADDVSQQRGAYHANGKSIDVNATHRGETQRASVARMYESSEERVVLTRENGLRVGSWLRGRTWEINLARQVTARLAAPARSNFPLYPSAAATAPSNIL